MLPCALWGGWHRVGLTRMTIAKNGVCMWLCSDMCCCLYLLMCVNFRFAKQHLVPVPVPDKRCCGTKGNEIGLGWQLAKHTHFTQTDALLPNEWAWQNCTMTRRKRIGNWMNDSRSVASRTPFIFTQSIPCSAQFAHSARWSCMTSYTGQRSNCKRGEEQSLHSVLGPQGPS